MPLDPPRRLVFCIAQMCFAHQDSVPLPYGHAIPEWPTKFGFDLPFCPSNNFSLYYTLRNTLNSPKIFFRRQSYEMTRQITTEKPYVGRIKSRIKSTTQLFSFSSVHESVEVVSKMSKLFIVLFIAFCTQAVVDGSKYFIIILQYII